MTGLINSITLANHLNEQYEFKIHKSKDGQFYWTIHNTKGNKEPVATSETYTSKQNAEHSISQVKRLAAGAVITDLTD
jgi:uncharacterized protein YegP (UPF0339 family)